jgi:hypothetical protein
MLRVMRIGPRVNGYAMTDGEFDLLAVNHLKRFALFVIVFARQGDAPSENGFVGFLCSPNDQLRLKDPGGILVLLWFLLRIDQK